MGLIQRSMAKPLLPDELWNRIAPLLPSHPKSPLGGRPRVPDRQALTGILFILKTGIPWEDLPSELGFGCGMTCWRRLLEWTQAGVWPFVLAHLHQELGEQGRINWERACLDSSLIQAKRGASKPAQIPATAGAQAQSITF
jgi:transposase